MNTFDKYRKLVVQLNKLTISGVVDWKLVGDGSTIQTFVGKDTVQISGGYKGIYELELLNDCGEIIDTFNSSQIEENDDQFNSYSEVFSELISTAKRRATGADQALDDVLNELDSLDF